MKKIFRHPLFSGSLIMVGGNMVVNAVNYIYHLVMGRVLGPIDYGVLASVYSILYLVSIIPSSASVAIVKFISSARSEKEVYSVYKSMSKLIFYIALTCSVIILFSSPVIAVFLHITNFWIIALTSFVLFFSLTALVNQSTSQGLLKFTGSVGPNFVSAVVKLVLGLVLVFIGWSVFGATFAVVIGAIISYLYSLWFIKRNLKTTELISFNLTPFLKYSVPVLFQAFAFTSLFTTDVILVKHFFPPFEAGIYAALSTLGKIIFFAVSPIAATMFPIVAGRKSRGEKYGKVFLASLGITLMVSTAVVLFYWLFPNIAIGVLYGKDYLSAKMELVWMGIFILFYTLSSLLVNFSLSLGKIRVVLFPFLAAVAQIIVLSIWHNSLLQVIQVSLVIMTVLFFVISIYLLYNRRIENYGKS